MVKLKGQGHLTSRGGMYIT